MCELPSLKVDGWYILFFSKTTPITMNQIRFSCFMFLIYMAYNLLYSQLGALLYPILFPDSYNALVK